ncbi:MAG: polyprenyl synthetase family protein [Clostridiales bacterium]|jgi:geranylgeranyl diphosphate synthase type II|nr:polyprenyl synthetase family protein [Clostridiales bacterium]
MTFERALAEKIKTVEAAVLGCLSPVYPEAVYEAMRYSVAAGGKRLRPVLLLSVCELFGGQAAEALPFACAIEMIHTYSLIHDDLPAMDDDDFRRGKLTNHRVFGEAIAILAGDGLLNMAYETMAAACEAQPAAKNIRALRVIAEAAGVSGMIGGQTADILSEYKNADSRELLYIHKHKTGALIAAAMRAGALLGGASAAETENVGGIGEKLGLAFQIKDDILDVTGSLEKLGKNIRADERSHKTTYVSVHGLERAQKDYMALCEEIAAAIGALSGDNQFLLRLSEKLTGREY